MKNKFSTVTKIGFIAAMTIMSASNIVWAAPAQQQINPQPNPVNPALANPATPDRCNFPREFETIQFGQNYVLADPAEEAAYASADGFFCNQKSDFCTENQDFSNGGRAMGWIGIQEESYRSRSCMFEDPTREHVGISGFPSRGYYEYNVALEVAAEILTEVANNDDAYCDGISIFSGISLAPFDRDIFSLNNVRDDLYRPTYYCTYNRRICPDGYNQTTVTTSVLNPNGTIQTTDSPILCTQAPILEP